MAKDRINKVWKIRKFIKICDLVKIRDHQQTKLELYFHGPYIIRDISWNTVQLRNVMDGTKLERNLHIKNILPFNEWDFKISRS